MLLTTAGGIVRRGRQGQRGVVLFLALITLVMLTLTGLSLLRSADVGVFVSGNMAMKTSATRSGDAGIESAANWLYVTGQNNAATLQPPVCTTGGFFSSCGIVDDQATCAGLSTSDCWTALSGVYTPFNLGTDGAGNQVSYIIQRLCDAAQHCVTVLALPGDPTNPQLTKQATGPSNTYFRVFVRIDGPRNTLSFIQAVLVP